MNTTDQTGYTHMSVGVGSEADRLKNKCSMCSVKGCLHDDMDMENKPCNPTMNYEMMPKVEQAKKDCSMSSVNVSL